MDKKEEGLVLSTTTRSEAASEGMTKWVVVTALACEASLPTKYYVVLRTYMGVQNSTPDL